MAVYFMPGVKKDDVIEFKQGLEDVFKHKMDNLFVVERIKARSFFSHTIGRYYTPPHYELRLHDVVPGWITNGHDEVWKRIKTFFADHYKMIKDVQLEIHETQRLGSIWADQKDLETMAIKQMKNKLLGKA